MKKIILSLILIYSITSAFEVQKSNTFLKNLEPTKMTTSIIANMEDESKSNIQNVFREAIEASKSENICTNGSYTISPKYTYDKQTRTFAGYRGNITFKCKFENTKKLDDVITNLDSITSKKDKLKLTINPIKWIVKKEIVEKTNKELELKALLYAKSYQEFLSGVYNTQCFIKKVSLNPANTLYHPAPMMRASQTITTAPIKSEHTIRYSASYEFECD